VLVTLCGRGQTKFPAQYLATIVFGCVWVIFLHLAQLLSHDFSHLFLTIAICQSMTGADSERLKQRRSFRTGAFLKTSFAFRPSVETGTKHILYSGDLSCNVLKVALIITVHVKM